VEVEELVLVVSDHLLAFEKMKVEASVLEMRDPVHSFFATILLCVGRTHRYPQLQAHQPSHLRLYPKHLNLQLQQIDPIITLGKPPALPG
jgi:hypothetical protein